METTSYSQSLATRRNSLMRLSGVDALEDGIFILGVFFQTLHLIFDPPISITSTRMLDEGSPILSKAKSPQIA